MEFLIQMNRALREFTRVRFPDNFSFAKRLYLFLVKVIDFLHKKLKH